MPVVRPDAGDGGDVTGRKLVETRRDVEVAAVRRPARPDRRHDRVAVVVRRQLQPHLGIGMRERRDAVDPRLLRECRGAGKEGEKRSAKRERASNFTRTPLPAR